MNRPVKSEERKAQIKNLTLSIRYLLQNKWVSAALKLCLVGILVFSIYEQVFTREDLDEMWIEFQSHFSSSNSYWFILAVILMPLNWAVETKKWLVLIQKFEPLSFLRAFKGIFLGVAFSLFTPNRIGEYGGRILVVKAENNTKTIVATLVSSFSQQIALLGLGTVGLIFFLCYEWKNADPTLSIISGIIGLFIISSLLISYYKVHLAIPLFNKIPYLRRFTKDMAVLKEYTTQELTNALLYAILRYIIYTFQYYFILQFFGIDVGLLTGLSCIATIFLVQTSIPLPAILDLFVRSEVALNIWGMYTHNEISIIASTFGLWFINIIIPSIFGAILIFSVNIMKSIGVGR